MIPKKDLKKIKNLKGKVRGVTFETDLKYVETLEGKEERKKVACEISKQEPGFDPEKIKSTEWYPLHWRLISLLTIKNYFNWSRDDIFDMGHAAPSNSFVVKIILRYFVSFEKTCREAATYWGKHYSTGKFETTEFKPKEKKVVYTLYNFQAHPDLCTYLMGYFKAITELTNKSKKINIKETQCMFKGDKYHRFEIHW